jgi:ATP-dependent RNA helicase RhlE
VSFCSNEEKNLLDAIEKWMDKKIKIFEVSETDYDMTLDFSDAAAFGIKDALKEIEAAGNTFKQGKKKKK